MTVSDKVTQAYLPGNHVNLVMDFSQLVFPEPAHKVNSCIALLGGGGKTGLQHRLGREFARHYNRVLLTSLTKSAYHADPPILCLDEMTDRNLEPHFARQNPLCLMGNCQSPEKMNGISPADLDELRHQAQITIVECDGARNRPLKAHQAHDPVIPDYFDRVIILVGADVVETTLNDGLVHRPELFQMMWNIDWDEPLTVEFITVVVTSQKGYLTKVHPNIPRTYFVNKSDQHNHAEELAEAIARRVDDPVFYGSVQMDLLERVQ